MLRNNLKYYLIILALIVSFIGGWQVSKRFNPQQEKQEVAIEEKTHRKIIATKNKVTDKVVTVTKPDGTKIVTTEKTKENTRIDKKEDKTQSTKITVTPKNNYSLGLQANTKIERESIGALNFTYTITGGYRIIDDIWVTSSINTSSKEIGIGIRYDW